MAEAVRQEEPHGNAVRQEESHGNTVGLDELHDIPITVAGVQFIGTERTKVDILEPTVQKCLQAKTFGELTLAMAETSNKLARLELFKDVRFIVDREPEGDNVVVRVEVQERKYKVHVGTEIQKNEVGFGSGGTFFNMFGRGEKLDMNASIGAQSATPLSVPMLSLAFLML